MMTKPNSISLPDAVKSTRVLLIDDESTLNFLEDALRRLGIDDIARATDGQMALALIDKVAEPPQLLICGLAMPGMDGIEFFRHLAERHFAGGVIVVSGIDRRLVMGMRELMGAHQLRFLSALHKPIEEAALVTALLKSADISHQHDDQIPAATLSPEEIHTALTTGCVETFFQPKVSISGRSVLGAECLARLRHPQWGLLPPAAFIRVAEEHDGLIERLTITVFRQAMQHLRTWMQQSHDPKLTVSVNVFMSTLSQPDLPDLFADIVQQNGLDTKQVVLEMTASRLMDDLTRGLEVINRLRLKGFGLSIDDFGTGYSSIEKLRLLPLTELKINHSFICSAAEDATARTILESSIRMGRALGMNIIAGGVETWENWDLVTTMGCNEVQGYFIAKPMPAEEFISWKTRWEE